MLDLLIDARKLIEATRAEQAQLLADLADAMEPSPPPPQRPPCLPTSEAEPIPA
jgi:hypothetical protein